MTPPSASSGLRCSCVCPFRQADHLVQWGTPPELLAVTGNTSVLKMGRPSMTELKTQVGQLFSIDFLVASEWDALKTADVWMFEALESQIQQRLHLSRAEKALQDLSHTSCITCLGREARARNVRRHGIAWHAAPRMIRRRRLWEPHVACIARQLPRLAGFRHCSSITNLAPGSVDQIGATFHRIDQLLWRTGHDRYIRMHWPRISLEMINQTTQSDG